jgi:hypothetical protein
MRKIIQYLAVALMFAVPAIAQGTSGSTSNMSGQTTTKHKTRNKSASDQKTHQVTGCLKAQNDEGAYLLTNGHYPKGLEVGGNDALKDHVGHTVTLKGTWASGAEIGENESAEKNEASEKNEAAEKHEMGGMHERHLKVASITMKSESCQAPAAHHGKKAAASKPAQ